MKRSVIGAVLAGLALVTWTCKGDPTSSLRGGPAVLSPTPTIVFLDPGATKGVLVTGRDAQLNPVPVEVTASSADPAVAQVDPDPSRTFSDGATHAFIITATGTSGEATVIRFQAGGLRDSTMVNIN